LAFANRHTESIGSTLPITPFSVTLIGVIRRPKKILSLNVADHHTKEQERENAARSAELHRVGGISGVVRASQWQGRGFVNTQGEPLKGYKHWFDAALREAGISFFTWYWACGICSRAAWWCPVWIFAR